MRYIVKVRDRRVEFPFDANSHWAKQVSLGPVPGLGSNRHKRVARPPLNSSCSSVSARSGSSGRRQTRSVSGALRSRKLSEKRLRRLARSFGKRPEELERANSKEILSFVVLPSLAEADEAEGPARGSS